VTDTTPQAEQQTAATIALQSFGYKFGLPPDAEWMVDVRMVRNPFWVPELRPRTGLDPEVSAYVLDDPVARELIDRTRALVIWSAQRYTERGRPSLNVAIGCTGGRHRSVAIVEALAVNLREDGIILTIGHRDVDTPDPRFE
jgi:UPF0042 nucleotide-binding protein